MSKFWIGEPPTEEITEICWKSKDGEEEDIVNCGNLVKLPNSIWKEDIPKLLKALQKAKELGWWKDEEDKV